MEISNEFSVEPSSVKRVLLKESQADIQGDLFSEEEVKKVIFDASNIEESALLPIKVVQVENVNEPVKLEYKLDKKIALEKYNSENVIISYTSKGEYENLGFSSDTQILVEYMDDDGECLAIEFLATYNPQKSIWINDEVIFSDQGNDLKIGIQHDVVQSDNPYAGHELVFTVEQQRLANKIVDIFKGSNREDLLAELGITIEDANTIVKVSNSLIETYFEFWMDEANLQNNRKIPDYDKVMILAQDCMPDNARIPGITPLLEKTKSLLARYIVQSYPDLKIPEVDLSYIENVVHTALEKYLNVYAVDIPMYDLLYQDFERLKKEKGSIFEIYLGRDGIYAFEGRHAAGVAQRQLLKSGADDAKRPKYLVYPRLFSQYLSRELKLKYLQQEGIVPENDPYFADTGFRGSIPEDIMQTMNFPPSEFDRRIKLLSADNPDRQVSGMPDKSRETIINDIEHNSKMNYSSEGLWESNGHLKPIERPTSPQDQFNYLMIRQALIRHYWIKEYKRHQESLTSEPAYEMAA